MIARLYSLHAVSALAGSTKQFDQNCLIHAMWKQLAVLNVNVWVERVPSKDNIADDPSRHVCRWGVHALRDTDVFVPGRNIGSCVGCTPSGLNRSSTKFS